MEIGRGPILCIAPSAFLRERWTTQWGSGLRFKARFVTWPDVWARVREASEVGPGFLSKAARRAALCEAVRQIRAEGGFVQSAQISHTVGFRTYLLEQFSAWRLAGLTAEQEQPAGSDPDVWACYLRDREILALAGGEDELGAALWAISQIGTNSGSFLTSYPSVLVIDPSRSGPLAWRAMGVLQRHTRSFGVWLPGQEGARPEMLADLQPIERKLLDWGLERVELPAFDSVAESAMTDVTSSLFQVEREGTLPAFASIEAWGMPEGEGEARAVASAVRSRLVAGASPHEILVTYPQEGELVDRIEETLTSWGIPVARSWARPLSRDPAVALLLRALRIPVSGWETSELVHLLRHGLIAPEWAEFGTREVLAEAACGLRETQVFRGRQALESILEKELPEETSKRAEARQAERKRWRVSAREVLERLTLLLEPFEEPAAWSEHCDRLENLAAALGLTRQESVLTLDALYLALDDQDEIRGRAELPDAPWTTARFLVEVEQIAAEQTWTAPVRPGVMLATADQVAGDSVPHLILAGLVEGSFPDRQVLEKPLVSALEEDPEAPVQERWLDPCSLAREMRRFVSVLACAQQTLALVYPSTSADGQRLLPAGFLEELRRLFIPGAWKAGLTELARLSPTLNSSLQGSLHDERLSTIAQALKVQNADLENDVLAAVRSLARKPGHRPVLAAISNGIRVNHLRVRRKRFGQFDGLLKDPAVVQQISSKLLGNRSYSISELETFSTCPFQYYVGNVLRLRPVPVNDEFVEDRTVRGFNIHQALEQFHDQIQGGSLPPDAVPATLRERLNLILDGLRSAGPQPRTDLEAGLQQLEADQLKQICLKYVDQWMDYRAKNQGAEPFRFELAFGKSNDPFPPLTLGTPETGEIRLAGRIDRLDLVRRDDAEYVRIIDYKTGTAPGRKELDQGMALQLPLYLLAASQFLKTDVEYLPLDVAYWSLKGKGFGVLYPPKKRSSEDPKELWQAMEEQLTRFLLELYELMKSGAFVVAPRQDHCESRCDFGSVCRIRQLRSLKQPKTFDRALPILQGGD